MNREIKFRIWNKKKQTWIHGPGEEVSLFGEMILLGGFLKGIPISEINDCVALQYTGIKDKNGGEVYNGDIVIIQRYFTKPFINNDIEIEYKFVEGEFLTGLVYWDTFGAKYLVDYSHIRYDDIEEFNKPSHRIEVIGNIYDNPELLKK